MIATLILLACPPDLSACRRERFPSVGGYVSASQIIAEWAVEHEGYRVISWSLTQR